MITKEKFEEIINNDSNYPFREKNVDHTFKALALLREKIPFDVCCEVIIAAECDRIYLPYVDDILEYIDENDAEILADCNVGIDNDKLFIYV